MFLPFLICGTEIFIVFVDVIVQFLFEGCLWCRQTYIILVYGYNNLESHIVSVSKCVDIGL